MNADVPVNLTLKSLRSFVQLSGIGVLLYPGQQADRTAPLGPAVIDSRVASQGSLFVALPGETTDGHQFISDAVDHGATAVIAERVPELCPAVAWIVPYPLRALQSFAAWWREQFPALPVIGITGSVGKTTAKEVLSHALGSLLPAVSSPRSFNNEIGVPLTLLSLNGSHCAAVLEMGMYDVGDIAFLAGIARQTIGVVLNVDAVHIERAGTIERIAQAKAEIVTSLPSTGVAVLNSDDLRVRAMAQLAPGRVITFGLQPGADWQAVDVVSSSDSLSLTITHEQERYPLRLPLPGRHHAYSLLAAAAAMDAAGIDAPRIVTALASVPALTLRQRFVRLSNERLVIDDSYNAFPLSMIAALDVLASQPATRRIAILGDMLELGPDSAESHALVGAHAVNTADVVLAVGPHAKTISESAGGKATHFDTKAELRLALTGLSQPGDAILVKGSRGMAMEEVVAWLCREQ